MSADGVPQAYELLYRETCGSWANVLDDSAATARCHRPNARRHRTGLDRCASMPASSISDTNCCWTISCC
ncbi:hypothetical protein ACTMU2_00990 [Cupriavidus basilensis]